MHNAMSVVYFVTRTGIKYYLNVMSAMLNELWLQRPITNDYRV